MAWYRLDDRTGERIATIGSDDDLVEYVRREWKKDTPLGRDLDALFDTWFRTTLLGDTDFGEFYGFEWDDEEDE